MKKFLTVVGFAFSVVFPSGVQSAVESTGRIQNLELDAQAVHRIPCFPDIPTTLVFPAPVASYKGLFFTRDPTQDWGDWLVDFKSGSRYLTLVPLARQSETRVLNIVTGNEIYVIEPFVASMREDAAAVVRFRTKGLFSGAHSVSDANTGKHGESIKTNPPPASRSTPINRKVGELPPGTKSVVTVVGKSGNVARVSTSTVPPRAKAKTVSPAFILGFLDRVKLLSANHSKEKLEGLVRAMPSVTMALKKNDAADYEFFQIVLKAVVRDSSIDAVGFAFTVENRSRYDLTIDPEGCAVRVGNRIYRQVLADVTPALPAQGHVDGYFVIVGDGQGGRNDLCPENDFGVILKIGQPSRVPQRVDHSKAPPDKSPVAPTPSVAPAATNSTSQSPPSRLAIPDALPAISNPGKKGSK